MTFADYDELLEQQGNKCGICEITLDEFKKVDGAKTGIDMRPRMFSVDHCHTTDEVRGLLCSQCNRGIGILGDTSVSLLKAVRYLEAAENKLTNVNNKRTTNGTNTII